MNKMTPWFPPHIKPVHKGLYEIKFTDMNLKGVDDPMYATWNGLRWSSASYQKSGGYHKMFYGVTQDKYWRGFKEKQT